MSKPFRVIGKDLPRPDAWEKVRGRPIYAGDFSAVPFHQPDLRTLLTLMETTA